MTFVGPAAVAAMLVAAVIAAVYIRRQPGLGSVRSEEATVGKKLIRSPSVSFAVLWFSIIAGMLTIELYRLIKTGKQFAWTSVLLAAILSPLVCRATIGKQTQLLRSPLYSIFLNGYQAGFFWQTVLGQALPS